MYNLEQLRMFAEAAETGSFSACARKLGKAQSAISQGIANLEIDLGVELFDRSTRKPTLTVEGQRLLAYAKTILLQSEELNKAALSILRQEENTVTLAIDHALQMPSLSGILEDFQSRFPATSVEILAMASPDICQLVDEQRADIGFMFSNMAYSRNVDVCYAGNITVEAVCANTHALAQRDSVEMSDLAGHTQIITRGLGMGGLDHEVRVAAMVWSTNCIPSTVELVKQGIGWAYLPSHLVDTPAASDSLHRLPMRLDRKPWQIPVERITQKNRPLGPGLRHLSEALLDMID